MNEDPSGIITAAILLIGLGIALSDDKPKEVSEDKNEPK